MHLFNILFTRAKFWAHARIGRAVLVFLFFYYLILFYFFFGVPNCSIYDKVDVTQVDSSGLLKGILRFLEYRLKNDDEDEDEDEDDEVEDVDQDVKNETDECKDIFWTQQRMREEIHQVYDTHKMYTKVLTFVLGFYVATMMKRWWEQVSKMPDITLVAMKLNALVNPGNNLDQGMQIKHTVLRYCLLSYHLLMIEITKPDTSRKAFISRAYSGFRRDTKRLKPSTLKFDEVEAKGLLLPTERALFHGKDMSKCWWIPMNWACKIIQQNPEMIKQADKMVDELIKYQSNLHSLLVYHVNPLPNLSGQAVHLACWVYLMYSTYATQVCEGEDHHWLWLFIGVCFIKNIFDFLKKILFRTFHMCQQ